MVGSRNDARRRVRRHVGCIRRRSTTATGTRGAVGAPDAAVRGAEAKLPSRGAAAAPVCTGLPLAGRPGAELAAPPVALSVAHLLGAGVARVAVTPGTGRARAAPGATGPASPRPPAARAAVARPRTRAAASVAVSTEILVGLRLARRTLRAGRAGGPGGPVAPLARRIRTRSRPRLRSLAAVAARPLLALGLARPTAGGGLTCRPGSPLFPCRPVGKAAPNARLAPLATVAAGALLGLALSRRADQGAVSQIHSPQAHVSSQTRCSVPADPQASPNSRLPGLQESGPAQPPQSSSADAPRSPAHTARSLPAQVHRPVSQAPHRSPGGPSSSAQPPHPLTVTELGAPSQATEPSPLQRQTPVSQTPHGVPSEPPSRAQSPQPLGAARDVSQPLACTPSQSPKPGSHGPTSHVPAAQIGSACSTEQASPQRPQLWGSVCRLNPSSATPLQLSSTPLHTSGVRAQMQEAVSQASASVASSSPPPGPASVAPPGIAPDWPGRSSRELDSSPASRSPVASVETHEAIAAKAAATTRALARCLIRFRRGVDRSGQLATARPSGPIE